MNVNTGAVLGMASYPTYEPSEFIGGISQEKWDEYTYKPSDNIEAAQSNRAIRAVYAPGSTFKMITAISGLETGKITATSTINDVGKYNRGHNPGCWIYNQTGKGHGPLNVKQAIQRSCNYFFYEVGYRVGIDTLYQYAKHFGLDSKTGIELPSENSGGAAQRSSAKDGWSEADTIIAAIGQGYNHFTPIEMAKYVSMLANGGKQVRPTIIKSIVKSDGTEISREEIRKYVDNKLGYENINDDEVTVSEETINIVKEGMLSVTSQPGGTAYNQFKDFGVQVAGKTGTADVEDSGKEANSWFVGFAPYNEPEIAVAVVIENGGKGQYAYTAARDVLAQYFGMNNDKIVEDRTTLPYVEIQN